MYEPFIITLNIKFENVNHDNEIFVEIQVK